MILYHRQLRPKVNNYGLTVERGSGYNLNVSLFERLVLKGFPRETLQAQHRMRPEISALIRELTYPDLVDAPSTVSRPDIHGLRDNIVFINHAHPEDDKQATNTTPPEQPPPEPIQEVREEESPGRDPGVTDAVWKQLQADKATAMEEQK
jgi:superfamily I DNA and/or RNA helicase